MVVADALESWDLPKPYGLALGAVVVPWKTTWDMGAVSLSDWCLFQALPLSFMEQKYLAFSSSLSVAANIYLVGVLALEVVDSSWVCLVLS